MLDVIVFIMHKDLNTVLSCLVFLEDNSILLLTVNPITLLGQAGAFCANIFGRSEKIILCGWPKENTSEFFSRSKSLEIPTQTERNMLKKAFNFDCKTFFLFFKIKIFHNGKQFQIRIKMLPKTIGEIFSYVGEGRVVQTLRINSKWNVLLKAGFNYIVLAHFVCSWFSNKDFIDCVGNDCAINTDNPSIAGRNSVLDRRNPPVDALKLI